MAKQIINIGRTANDRSGDPLRSAFDKVNQNFTELYDTISATGGTGVLLLQNIPLSKFGQENDKKGMVAINDTTGDFYYCIKDYTDGLTSIWRKTSGSDAW